MALEMQLRRTVLLVGATSAALCCVTSAEGFPGANGGASLAAAGEPQSKAPAPEPSMRSQILKGFRIGEADVYYPSVFLGGWRCRSTLISVDTPQGEEVVDAQSVEDARRRLGSPVVYQATFVNHDGHVVADRLRTTESLLEATVGRGLVEDAEWSPSKPSLLTLTLRGGLRVWNLVTKRSFELSGPGQFDVSEYSKQVVDNPVRLEGPPRVKASGNLTRFRWDPEVPQVTEIEAFQKVSMYPVVGGPAAGRGEGGLTLMDVVGLGLGERPTTVYKYLLHMERLL